MRKLSIDIAETKDVSGTQVTTHVRKNGRQMPTPRTYRGKIKESNVFGRAACGRPRFFLKREMVSG